MGGSKTVDWVSPGDANNLGRVSQAPSCAPIAFLLGLWGSVCNHWCLGGLLHSQSCNALYMGLSRKSIPKLQLVQNAAAQAVMITSWSMHAALVLQAALAANIPSHSVHGAAWNLESPSWHWARRNHLSLFMSTVPLSLAEEACSGCHLY